MKRIKNPKLKTTTIYIKNMVCDRCIRVVRDELHNLGYDVRNITLGEAELSGPMATADIVPLKQMLEKNGFELIEDKKVKIIESIKTAIIQLVHHNHDKEPMKMKYSEYIAQNVGKDYHSLSTLFSSVENITIEQYLIKQKIERVKELIKYDDRSLSEISYMMNYSSVQHLSTQFKQTTGLTVSEYKHLGVCHRHPLDAISSKRS